MRRFEDDERSARLVARHHLRRTAANVEAATRGVVAIHSSDPASVYLAMWSRVSGLSRERMSAALYDDRSLVRLLGMRRTMFVFERAIAPIIQSGATERFVEPQTRRLAGWLEADGIAKDGAAWIEAVSDLTAYQLAEVGSASARELSSAIPELRTRINVPGGAVGATTRILFLMATQGRVVRGRPNGSWTSSQYRWSLTEDWLGEGLETVATEEAQERILERYLERFGPVSETDCAWWTGWNLTTVRRVLASLDAKAVHLSTGTGFILPDDDAESTLERSVALLPALDSTPMGWKERGWFVGRHQGELFDRNGNIGPTVWVDGRIVGAWGQASSGPVIVRLLEAVDRRSSDAIEMEATSLSAWIGEARVKARFPTPLERSIRAL